MPTPHLTILPSNPDFFDHRYTLSRDRGREVPNDEAFAHRVAAGIPGHPLP